MSYISKFNQNLPRYTSYPTAPAWEQISSAFYQEKLDQLSDHPLSLYFHIPFCKSMCLFCGCSVILNRNPTREIEYVELLCKEIDLVAKKKRKASQLHFGGGTPTKLSIELLEILFNKIQSRFDLEGEIAIEIDPRTVFDDRGAKLRFLKKLGFNRASFGVQDLNETVQEAIKRHQSKEMTLYTYQLAREIGFQEINCDLIYGLPFQTLASFEETIEAIIEMHPDRIALFSYAKIPWLKPHQKAIKEETLPTTEEKFAIYAMARKRLIESGYVAIGMDHFALATSDLAKSYAEKTLHRNFQGYTVMPANSLIGFGVTAIGYVEGCYFQNVKDLKDYQAAIQENRLPTYRGKILSQEDFLRKWVIEKLMCTFEVNKGEFFDRFSISFDEHFHDVDLSDVDALIDNSPEKLLVTPQGELFVRNIAAHFDAYLGQTKAIHSKAI